MGTTIHGVPQGYQSFFKKIPWLSEEHVDVAVVTIRC
jgi:hypothetical protein